MCVCEHMQVHVCGDAHMCMCVCVCVCVAVLCQASPS